MNAPTDLKKTHAVPVHQASVLQIPATGATLQQAVSAPAVSQISQPSIVASVLAFDTLAITASGAATASVWQNAANTGWLATSGCIVVIAAISLTGLRKSWTYTIPSLSGMTRQLALTGMWLFLALCALIVAGFLTSLPDAGMKPWIAYWFGAGWGTLAVSRIGLSIWLKRQARAGTLARRTVIAGGGEAAATLIEQLSKSGNADIKILGMFDDRGTDRSPDSVGGYAKLGNFDELAEFCRLQKIDLIIVALPPTAEERILHLLKKL